ncbi:glycerophosphoryl diester phosphodiesterase [Deinobacterium chartae]|uniref:Glycerophosphoryl diester phosphodiesterase n=1 Tax=Deinobacterium chartae TaxID=521158 RepID=A0A841HWQ1_9DEIO|nr:glycerophosphodiester phosphodiesterase [Deinobacterium chartae]MBB6097283.1 glycerophosphoryl diester phosphodiesterase [Deinobacterium chartae]
MLLLGHRGTPRLHPENTLAGFRAALEAGLHGVEIDVQPTSDGQLAVHHDPHLTSGRRLREHTLEELRLEKPDLPSLPEVLRWFAGSGAALLNVELKNETDRNDGREALLVQALRDVPLGGRVVVSCFHPLSLQRLHALDPELRLGYLTSDHPASKELQALAAPPPLYSVHPHFSTVTSETMQAWHARGLKVFAWTVNDPLEAQRLAELGVDGLIGDLPDVLRGAAPHAATAAR